MQFIGALYRAEMHSQAHGKTNNHLKTKHYKIGINLPQKIYEFSKTGMIVTAKNKVHNTVSWAANALYLELNMLPSAHQKQNSYITWSIRISQKFGKYGNPIQITVQAIFTIYVQTQGMGGGRLFGDKLFPSGHQNARLLCRLTKRRHALPIEWV